MTNDEIRLKIARLKSETYYELPDWPTDPAAAMELVEECPAMHIDWCMKSERFSEFMWKCRVGIDSSIVCYADTFCRAVSLAWIAWKEQVK